MGVCTCSVLLLFSAFLILPFGMGMSVLRLFYHYVLEAFNLFDFTGSLLERNVLQDESYLESYPY